ncbi:toxin-activating lysine-acyltransferase [Marivibrio halodurans]|uniref:RTX toxin-activating lysine-acyltransferase n=1 Tax=Marivibrio halodurans TaxID=2039722 RepID=A0A8J7SAL1_9PROT|nr:toxin-activating lysine-acyltransferase [Marivibrio halodurans]
MFEELEAGRSRLRVADWRCGEIPVAIDLAAPFGGADPVLAALDREVFDGAEHFVMTTDPETGKRMMRRASGVGADER